MDKKEGLYMKYRVATEKNYSQRMGVYLCTYFRTKREAVSYAEMLGASYIIERKIGGNWVAY